MASLWPQVKDAREALARVKGVDGVAEASQDLQETLASYSDGSIGDDLRTPVDLAAFRSEVDSALSALGVLRDTRLDEVIAALDRLRKEIARYVPS